MTLKEQFQNIELDDPYIYMKEEEAEKCIKITDEFTTEVLEWYMTLLDRVNIHELKINYSNKTPKQILEIYKKENNL